MAVVKADAYGLGIQGLLHAISPLVHSLAVATLSEANEIRHQGFPGKIYTLSPLLLEEMPAAATLQVVPAISTIQELHDWQRLAASLQKNIPVNITLDTGMGRVGFLPADLPALVAAWPGCHNLSIDSISSHYASADEDPGFSQQQSETYRAEVAFLEKHGLQAQTLHLANSAGLLNYSSQEREVARCGLMLYGVSPIPAEQAKLQSVLTWHTKVTLVREMPAGWGVSYGRTFVTTAPTRVATLAVGYADGYRRALSGKGACVLIHGRRCPVLGRVTMDQIMVDVTQLPEPVGPGDVAVLLGRQGAEEITAGELATLAGTIPYEIFTGIGHRVVRIYEE
jgi:alanine racemase